MVNVFSSNKSDIVVEVNTLNTIILWWIFFFQTDEVTSWSPDSEYYNLTHVYGESFIEPSIMYNVAELNSVNQAENGKYELWTVCFYLKRTFRHTYCFSWVIYDFFN